MNQPSSSRAKIIILSAIAGLLIAGFFAYKDYTISRQFRFVFLDVGQGDAALIHLPNSQKMLIDCGPDKSILNKLSKYLGFFDRTIDYLVITHAHKDHYGGCIEVLKKYQIKTIIENLNLADQEPHWQAWQELTAEKQIEKIFLIDKKIINIQNAEIIFFPPPKDKYSKSNENNQSIVMHLTYGTSTVLFTGDIEEPRIIDLLEENCSEYKNNEVCPALNAFYLKIPHHGSPGSLNNSFYVAVSPKMSVFSVGKNNYGHPSLRVIKNLERLGSKIWRTDLSGDLVIK